MSLPTFKECVSDDRSAVFINFAEFGTEHVIDGKTIIVVVDDSEREYRGRTRGVFPGTNTAYGARGGIFGERILFYARTEDIGDAPRIGRIMTFDGIACTVSDVQEDMGIYTITLEANRH